MPLVTGEPAHLLTGVRNLADPDVAALIHHLRSRVAAQGPRLRDEAPATVARAAEWVLDHSRELADAVLTAKPHLPYSRPMVLEAFENTLRRWHDADRLVAFVREETAPVASSRAIFPQVVFINLAGNLFVSGWEAITHAVLLGSAAVVRCSEADPLFPGIWAMALARFSTMGNDIATICEWPRHDFSRFRAASEAADAVVTFGGEDAVRSVRDACPWNKPFAGHGSTVSFSVITAEELRHHPVEWLAEHCAYDFAVYDQQGCLSPRAIFIEDARSRDVDRFVDGLHGALVKWEKVLPRRALSLEDSAAMARARDAVLLDAACGGPARRVSGDADPFLLTVKPVEQFSLGPVNRYADVYLYKTIDEVQTALQPFRGHVSTLGLVDPRRSHTSQLGAINPMRICEIGQMQKPSLAWCLDGYRPLQKMLRYQTIQPG